MPGVDRESHRGARGVSPVIGVVLMVSIVVLLSVAAGALAFQYSDEGKEPQPTMATTQTYLDETSGDGEQLEIVHESGDTVSLSDLEVTVSGAVLRESAAPSNSCRAEYKQGTLASDVGTEWAASETFVLDETTFDPESGCSLSGDTFLDLSETTVEIAWLSENEEESAVIYTWDGPDA